MTGVELFTLGSTAITLGDVALVAGSLTSAIGASQQFDATAQSAEYSARAAKIEAQAEESRLRRESRREMGRIRTAVSKGGVTREGSPLLVLSESAELAELDALNVRYTGARTADLEERRAASARRAKPYAVGAALLSGASRLGRSQISKGA